jgi:TP901 family phage tail tape measure protein
MAVSQEQLTVQVVLDSKGAIQGIKDLSGNFVGMQKLVESNSRVLAKLNGDLRDVAKSSGLADKLAAPFKALEAGIGRVALPVIALNQAFQALGQVVGLLGGAFQKTAGAALELETVVARISTVIEPAQRGLVDFEKQILALQRAFGTSKAESGAAFYEALASGAVDASGSVELLNTAQKLAIGGVTSLDTAVSGLLSVLSSYSLQASDAAKVSDALFIAAAGGRTDIKQLGTDIGRVANLAKESGVSLQELLGSVSAVTLAIPSTSEAVSGLRGVISALLTPTDELKKVYADLGISSASAEIQANGLGATLEKLRARTDGSAESLAKLLGRIEAAPAAIALTSGTTKNAAEQITRDIERSFATAGAVTQERFEQIAATGEFQMKRLGGQVNAALTQIGRAFNATFGPLASVLADGIGKAAEVIGTLGDRLARLDLKGLAREFGQTTLIVGGLTAAVGTLAVAFTLLSTGSTLAALTGVVEILGLMRARILAAATPILVVAAKFALITGAVLAAVAAIDILVRNVGNLKALFLTAMEAIRFAVLKTVQVAVDALGGLFVAIGLDKVAAKLIRTSDNAAAQLAQSADALAKKSDGLDFGLAGKAVEGIRKLFGPAGEEAEKVGAATKKATEETKQQAVAVAAVVKASKELLALRESIFDLENQLKAVGESEFDGIQRQLALNVRNLMAQGEAAVAAGENAEAVRKLVALGVQRAEQLAGAQAAELVLKDMRAAEKSAEEALSKVREDRLMVQEKVLQAGMNEIQRLERAYVLELERLDAIEAQARAAGKLDAISRKELDLARETLRTRLDVDKGEVMKKEADRPAGAEKALSAAQGFLDQLSKVPNIIAQIISAIARLPQLILGIVEGATDLLFKQIFEFPQKLLMALERQFSKLDPAVFEAFINSLVQTVPRILVLALAEIPKKLSALTNYFIPQIIGALIEGILAALPELLQYFIQSMTTGILTNAALLISGIIKALPRVIVALAKAIPKIVPALIEALIDGLKDFGRALASIFTGASPFKNVGKDLGKGITDATKKVTGVSSELFAVLEGGPGKAGKDQADRIRDAIDGATRNAANILGKLWDALKRAWKFVYDTFLKPWLDLFRIAWEFAAQVGAAIWGGIKAAWTASLELFKGVWSGSMALFRNVWEVGTILAKGAWNLLGIVFRNGVAIFEAMWSTVKVLFSSVIDSFRALWDFAKNVFKDPIGAFQKLFEDFSAIFSNISASLGGLGKTILDGVTNALGSIGDTLYKAGEKIWSGLKDSFTNGLSVASEFGEAISNAFMSITSKIGAAFTGAFDSVGKKITEVLNAIPPKITAPIRALFGKFADALDAMKIPEVGFSVLGKSFGFGPFDLIPDALTNALRFNQGGMIPGMGQGDVTPIAGTPGEFVLNRGAVSRMGLPLLEALNEGRAGASAGMAAAPVNVYLTVQTEQPIDEKFVKSNLMPVVRSELRRASQAGEFVISPRGVKST